MYYAFCRYLYKYKVLILFIFFFFVICEDLSHESTTNEETTHFELLTKEPFHVKGNNYTFDNSAFLKLNEQIYLYHIR